MKTLFLTSLICAMSLALVPIGALAHGGHGGGNGGGHGGGGNWHGAAAGNNWHGGGWRGGGNGGNGWHNGGYGGWNNAGFWVGAAVVTAPYYYSNYSSYSECGWIPGHYDDYGYWIPTHRACW